MSLVNTMDKEIKEILDRTLNLSKIGKRVVNDLARREHVQARRSEPYAEIDPGAPDLERLANPGSVIPNPFFINSGGSEGQGNG